MSRAIRDVRCTRPVRTPELVRQWAYQQPAWLRTESPVAIDPSLDVDIGEAEAISLAVELKADALLIDDRKGRNAAMARGIITVGRIGVLEFAAERQLIDLPQKLDQLSRTNFRISERMLKAALQRDRVRREGPLSSKDRSDE